MLIQFAPSPPRVRRFLLACVGGLVLAHLCAVLLRVEFGHDYLWGLARLVDLDQEQNLPSLFSSLQLLACAGVLGFIAAGARARRDPDARYWVGLAVAFVYMGLDEAVSIHELLSAPVAGVHGAGGPRIHGVFAWYAWVLPYAGLALAFGAAYLRFLARLPRATAIQFAAAGTAFVAGAVGIEVLESVAAAGRAAHPLLPVLCTTTQEIVEMVSITCFLTALLRYVERVGGVMEVRLALPAAAGAPALAVVGEARPRPRAAAPRARRDAIAGAAIPRTA